MLRYLSRRVVGTSRYCFQMENLMALKSTKRRNFSFESPTVIEQVAYSIQAPLGTMDSDQVANIRASVIGFIEKGN